MKFHGSISSARSSQGGKVHGKCMGKLVDPLARWEWGGTHAQSLQDRAAARTARAAAWWCGQRKARPAARRQHASWKEEPAHRLGGATGRHCRARNQTHPPKPSSTLPPPSAQIRKQNPATRTAELPKTPMNRLRWQRTGCQLSVAYSQPAAGEHHPCEGPGATGRSHLSAVWTTGTTAAGAGGASYMPHHMMLVVCLRPGQPCAAVTPVLPLPGLCPVLAGAGLLHAVLRLQLYSYCVLLQHCII
jgi:hypothetical protein